MQKTVARKRKWQAYVFITAFVRFYLLGINEVHTLSNKSMIFGQQYTVLIAVFAYLFFGQIIDNRHWTKQKQIFCAL